MTEATFIQGGPGWRRTWRRGLGEAADGAAVTILNGHAQGYGVRSPDGAFSIKWMPQGSAVYRVDRASHRLSADHAVILNANQPYELEFTDPQKTESFCVFFPDGMVAQAWSEMNAPDPLAEADPGSRPPEFADFVFRPTAALGRRLARLRDAYGHPDPSAAVEEEHLLDLLIDMLKAARRNEAAAARLPSAKASTRRQLAARLERARELLEDADEEPSLGALAAASALSKFHLLRSFKAAFGCTPSAYRRARRLDRARRLLRATPMTVGQIGEALGYESTSAFIRAFRRHFGANPSAIRANLAIAGNAEGAEAA
jgi:AraC-like DNA-binding protein